MKTISEGKRRIYQTALKQFRAKGYEGTSMADIANEIGIRKASLYSHFKNKQAIFTFILETIISEHKNALQQLFGTNRDSNELQELRRIFVGYLKYCQNNTNIEFWTRFYYYPPIELKDHILSFTHDTESVFRDHITQICKNAINSKLIKELDAEAVMHAYYHLLLGFVLSSNDPKSQLKSAQLALDVFINGISN